MNNIIIMKITIIGIGLIGGSLAIDLRERGFASHITGVDNNPAHVNIALERGLIDEIATLEYGVDNADLVIITTPVDTITELLPVVLDRITDQVVTDMGSAKYKIAECVKDHPKRENYVPSHPMTGTEYSGPGAAIPGLFDDKCTILCDTEDCSAHAVDMIKKMYSVLKMRIININSEHHDISAAYVSHISHISSFALALTVMDIEKDEKKIYNMAGGGFESTVRLAKSSSDMWVPIFEQNSDNVLTALNNYIDKLQVLKIHLKDKKTKELHKMIKKSNRIGKILMNNSKK